jgi:GR25 family glycosyltransferase involved in LPS biosynthesis
MKLPRTFILTVNRPIKRFDDTCNHLNELGIKWEVFFGMDNQRCRLQPLDTFDLDRAGDKIGTKHVAATLTQYMLWKTMMFQKDDSFVALEFDVRFVPDWREQYEKAMSVMPDDWQVIFLGSCCCKGRDTKHIGENVYEVHWPLCGHALQIRQSALPTLLDEHQSISMPLDVAMFTNSLPKLRTYTLMPPICVQADTIVAP